MTRRTIDSDPALLKLEEPWRPGDRVRRETVAPPILGKEFELRLPLAGVRLASAGLLVSSLGDEGMLTSPPSEAGRPGRDISIERRQLG